MRTVLGLLKENAAAVQAVSAVLSLIVTSILAWITWRYVQLTRSLAETAKAQFQLEATAERTKLTFPSQKPPPGWNGMRSGDRANRLRTRESRDEEVLITRHGKVAGVLIGFASEDDWFDYRIENDPRFLDRIAAARASVRAGQGIRLEELIQEGSNKRLHADRGHRAISKKRPKRVSGGRGR